MSAAHRNQCARGLLGLEHNKRHDELTLSMRTSSDNERVLDVVEQSNLRQLGRQHALCGRKRKLAHEHLLLVDGNAGRRVRLQLRRGHRLDGSTGWKGEPNSLSQNGSTDGRGWSS